jgi:hypothetical protein
MCVGECQVWACDVFDTKRVVSTRIYVFGYMCFNVLKIKKPKHVCLRHVTRLIRRVKHVRIYTYLTCVNTCSTYKFNKFQTKLEKYIRKIKLILVIKNKINMSYIEISYKLEWSWSLISVSSQYFKHTSIFKSLICWSILYMIYVCVHVLDVHVRIQRVRRACSCSMCKTCVLTRYNVFLDVHYFCIRWSWCSLSVRLIFLSHSRSYSATIVMLMYTWRISSSFLRMNDSMSRFYKFSACKNRSIIFLLAF